MVTKTQDCSPLQTLVESSTTPHTATLVSMDPEASRWESGDQARAVTRERCTRNSLKTCSREAHYRGMVAVSRAVGLTFPSATLCTVTVLWWAAARYWPSGEYATAETSAETSTVLSSLSSDPLSERMWTLLSWGEGQNSGHPPSAE